MFQLHSPFVTVHPEHAAFDVLARCQHSYHWNVHATQCTESADSKRPMQEQPILKDLCRRDVNNPASAAVSCTCQVCDYACVCNITYTPMYACMTYISGCSSHCHRLATVAYWQLLQSRHNNKMCMQLLFGLKQHGHFDVVSALQHVGIQAAGSTVHIGQQSHSGRATISMQQSACNS